MNIAEIVDVEGLADDDDSRFCTAVMIVSNRSRSHSSGDCRNGLLSSLLFKSTKEPNRQQDILCTLSVQYLVCNTFTVDVDVMGRVARKSIRV